jgi:hypothetical protein
MFDGFERRARRNSHFGPQLQEGQQILDRAVQLGALSPTSARTRADLDVRLDPSWFDIVACGYLREADPGCFSLSHGDGSADRMAAASSSPFPLAVLVALIGVVFLLLILRRMGAL